LAGSLPATDLHHRTVTYTKDEEERGNLSFGKEQKQKERNPSVVWIDEEDARFPHLADRREKETGKRPVPTGSKYDTGQGYYFPADWVGGLQQFILDKHGALI
jgi:hypothetical protein